MLGITIEKKNKSISTALNTTQISLPKIEAVGFRIRSKQCEQA
tara:strand:+ start:149 stop:277 length:129 start_codon:yes stop_codon:yes gene_type:complete